MMIGRDAHRRTIVALAAASLMTGCADYGYGGVDADVGYAGRGYYADPYYDDYGYGYGYGYGWYGDYYYPGAGFYVFDRGGHRRRWSDDQRRYWEARREARGDWRGRRGPDGAGDARHWDGHRRAGDRRPPVGGVPPEAVGTAGAGDRDSFRARREAAVRAGAATQGAGRRETFRGRSGAEARPAPAVPRGEPRMRGGGGARGPEQ